MDYHKLSSYRTLVEGYGSAFSLYGALQVNSTRRVLSNDQCWCQDADKTYPPSTRCYPEVLCNSCDLEKSGLCPQGSGNMNVPGVN